MAMSIHREVRPCFYGPSNSYLVEGYDFYGSKLHSMRHFDKFMDDPDLSYPSVNIFSSCCSSSPISHNVGSYSASMANMVQPGWSALSSIKKQCSPSKGKTKFSAAGCCPVSESHLIAMRLERKNGTNNLESSRRRGSIVEAIERRIFHHENIGNTRISTNLHVGECCEVPEDMWAFTVVRNGAFKWRPLDYQSDPVDQANTKKVRRQRSVPDFTGRKDVKKVLVKQVKSEPQLSGKNQSFLYLINSRKDVHKDYSEVKCVEQKNDSGSADSGRAASDSSRDGSWCTNQSRRNYIFLWHRLKLKLKR